MASAAPDLGVSPRREGEPSPSPTGKRQIEFAEPPPKEDGFTDLSDVASSPQLARSGTCGSSFGSSHRPPLQRGLTSTGSTGSGALSSFKRQMSGAVCALSAVRRLKLYSREARSMNASKRRATEELSRKGVRQGTVRRSSFTRRRSFAAAADLMSRAMGTRDGQSHSVAAAGLIGQRLRGEELSLRQRLFLILEEPASSVTAYCVSVLIRTLTVGSAAAVTMESLEVLTESTGPHVWLAFAVTFNVCFTVEALVRVACYEPSPLEARHDAFIWLDVLCVVPFWLRVCIDGAAASGEVYLYYGESMISLRVLEAFASFRLLKLCRYYEGAGLLMRAVGRSMEQLYAPPFA